MKKLAVIGRGTIGCVTVAHFLRFTDWEVDWYYDPSIEPAAVGEGTTLILPKALTTTLDFDSVDMDNINATPKLGIWKRGWGVGTEYKHTFPCGDIGIHFNAVQFQKYAYDRLISNKRLKCIESNIIDLKNIDSDYVMVCTGSPKDSNSDEFINREYIPVNSARVFQCPWDYAKFNYSLTFARPYGWIFGIPLKNRCAIGYVYNNKYCTQQDIDKDVEEILTEFNLTPNLIRDLTFSNYSRKLNYSTRICYNGNASYFLEPLEATSTGHADFINRSAYDLWTNPSSSVEEINESYIHRLDAIEGMICLHYFSGSIYNTSFWLSAQALATEKIELQFKQKTDFAKILIKSYLSNSPTDEYKPREIGTWTLRSYKQNIANLGLKKSIEFLIHKYNFAGSV